MVIRAGLHPRSMASRIDRRKSPVACVDLARNHRCIVRHEKMGYCLVHGGWSGVERQADVDEDVAAEHLVVRIRKPFLRPLSLIRLKARNLSCEKRIDVPT